MIGSRVEAFLEQAGQQVDAALDRLLPPADQEPRLLHEAVRYSVFAGGKRFRPALVLASAQACGLDADAVLPVACAVEAVHTYSLIHDDLPSMDNADWRRGRPTCHVRYGEAIAILAGDALHDMAFQWILAASDRLGPPDRVLRVVLDLAVALGTQGMVGGQVLDLLAERGQVPADWVPEIHRRKTGCLIRACARVGPLLSGGEEDLVCLTAYGEHLGLAFQITDDVLDVVGEAEKLGKRTGADEASSKATYPKVFGLERSRQMAREEAEAAVAALRPLGPRGELLAELARFVVERER
ncbi:MAG: polyprenyl synthetase family protein [Firmicutes bacterium]|nr:polyprenyl synthetase family protein [Bacillota bacterium]